MQLSEEAVAREGKREKFLKMEEQLRVQRNLLDMDKKTVESFAEEIQKRSQELDETFKVENVVDAESCTFIDPIKLLEPCPVVPCPISGSPSSILGLIPSQYQAGNCEFCTSG